MYAKQKQNLVKSKRLSFDFALIKTTRLESGRESGRGGERGRERLGSLCRLRGAFSNPAQGSVLKRGFVNVSKENKAHGWSSCLFTVRFQLRAHFLARNMGCVVYLKAQFSSRR